MQEGQPKKMKEPTAQEKEDQALSRRGNAGLRKDLKDANRIYNPEVELEWKTKYKNFSGDHMRRAYRVYAEARHDPFNKSPEWTNQILRRINKEFNKLGITPEQEFKKMDVSGDGTLERAEVRRMLMDMVPDLGDMELAAIFEVLDQDHSNEISLEEFSAAIGGGKKAYQAPEPKPSKGTNRSSGSTESQEPESKGDHRTPVHRIKRIPPAQVEGWEHLKHNPQYKGDAELLKARDTAMFKRIGADLCLSPRQTVSTNWTKYDNFGGGGESARFRNMQWRREVKGEGDGSSIITAGAPSSITVGAASSVPDPGGLDVKPGYHIELAKMCPHYTPAVTPRRKF